MNYSNNYVDETESELSIIIKKLIDSNSFCPSQFLTFIQSHNYILNDRNSSPLLYAANKNKLEVIEIVLEIKEIEINIKNNNGDTLISFSSSK
jgi:ankyrin repeat protein